jgi:hypothetical protein
MESALLIPVFIGLLVFWFWFPWLVEVAHHGQVVEAVDQLRNNPALDKLESSGLDADRRAFSQVSAELARMDDYREFATDWTAGMRWWFWRCLVFILVITPLWYAMRFAVGILLGRVLAARARTSHFQSVP